jgi:membrane associated rhomboid family serine protease
MWQDRQYSSAPSAAFLTRAPATWAIIGITVLIHVVLVLLRRVAPDWHAAAYEFGASTTDGWHRLEIWRSVTSLLLHGGTGHILWNMLFLGFAGSRLEPHIGTRAFVRLYLAAGLVGSTSTLFYAHSSIGASGAINGVLVALAVFMPDVIILFMMLIPMKIKWVVTILIGIDLLNVIGGDGGATDSAAHLLGAATGFAIAFVGPRYVAPWLDRRRSERLQRAAERRREEIQDEERELDRLLEKIAKDGMPSLSEAERKFLMRVSGKYQGTKRE